MSQLGSARLTLQISITTTSNAGWKSAEDLFDSSGGESKMGNL